MINRIRDLRKAKGLTLAELAAACTPPTTAQTIGRLETGMRNLSVQWMERIAPGLGVPPEMLLHSSEQTPPPIVAHLTEKGAEPYATLAHAVPPFDFASAKNMMVLNVDTSAGEYRSGDQIWLEQRDLNSCTELLNRDVLAPRPGGRFAFGRLIDYQGDAIGILPVGLGQKQQVIQNPVWIAFATLLIRRM